METAIFYSINNAQNGLTSIGLGRILVFQVMEEPQALEKPLDQDGLFLYQ